jgi:hypothetical protein
VQTNDETMRELADAVDPAAPPATQVDQALDTYLASVLSRPVLHLSFIRELPALGAPGAERQLAVVERFAGLLVELVESGRAAHPELEARPLDPDVALIIVGGVRELMLSAAAGGRDLREVRRSASDAVNAILTATVL